MTIDMKVEHRDKMHHGGNVFCPLYGRSTEGYAVDVLLDNTVCNAKSARLGIHYVHCWWLQK